MPLKAWLEEEKDNHAHTFKKLPSTPEKEIRITKCAYLWVRCLESQADIEFKMKRSPIFLFVTYIKGQQCHPGFVCLWDFCLFWFVSFVVVLLFLPRSSILFSSSCHHRETFRLLTSAICSTVAKYFKHPELTLRIVIIKTTNLFNRVRHIFWKKDQSP